MLALKMAAAFVVYFGALYWFGVRDLTPAAVAAPAPIVINLPPVSCPSTGQ